MKNLITIGALILILAVAGFFFLTKGFSPQASSVVQDGKTHTECQPYNPLPSVSESDDPSGVDVDRLNDERDDYNRRALEDALEAAKEKGIPVCNNGFTMTEPYTIDPTTGYIKDDDGCRFNAAANGTDDMWVCPEGPGPADPLPGDGTGGGGGGDDNPPADTCDDPPNTWLPILPFLGDNSSCEGSGGDGDETPVDDDPPGSGDDTCPPGQTGTPPNCEGGICMSAPRADGTSSCIGIEPNETVDNSDSSGGTGGNGDTSSEGICMSAPRADGTSSCVGIEQGDSSTTSDSNGISGNTGSTSGNSPEGLSNTEIFNGDVCVVLPASRSTTSGCVTTTDVGYMSRLTAFELCGEACIPIDCSLVPTAPRCVDGQDTATADLYNSNILTNFADLLAQSLVLGIDGVIDFFKRLFG